MAFLHASAASRMRFLVSMFAVFLIVVSSMGGISWVLTHQPPDANLVSNLQDNDRPGSLRYAVDQARPTSIITFDASLRGTILLSSGDLNIAEDLTIRGLGASILSISGGRSGHSIVVPRGISATIFGLTFRDSVASGGFIDNFGTLTLTNSIVSGNTSTDGFGGGGGIYNDSGGTLTLTNSTISGNTSTGGSGGGIYIQGTSDSSGSGNISFVDLTFSTIYGNTAHSGADIEIEDVTFDSNGNSVKAMKQYSQVKIKNSIVAGDPIHPGPDIAGMLTSHGYNLFQAHSGATFDSTTHTQYGPDTILSVNDLTKLFASPLGLHHKVDPTKTLRLFPGTSNPAIDKIPLQYCHIKDIFNDQSRMYTDQRGMKRPDNNESACDIGAYESP